MCFQSFSNIAINAALEEHFLYLSSNCYVFLIWLIWEPIFSSHLPSFVVLGSHHNPWKTHPFRQKARISILTSPQRNLGKYCTYFKDKLAYSVNNLYLYNFWCLIGTKYIIFEVDNKANQAPSSETFHGNQLPPKKKNFSFLRIAIKHTLTVHGV